MDPPLGSMVTVRKIDYATGHVVYSWPGTLIENDEVWVVRALFVTLGAGDRQIGNIALTPGDIFNEFYFPDRWYNIFHIADSGGRHKGWYCNVTRPPVFDDDGVSYVDLALDLVVYPDLGHLVLDEDEFDAASFHPDEVAHAREALAELIHLARGNLLPKPREA